MGMGERYCSTSCTNHGAAAGLRGLWRKAPGPSDDAQSSSRLALTLCLPRHTLISVNLQVRAVGKAVRFGHGPATVIGRQRRQSGHPPAPRKLLLFARKSAAGSPMRSRGAFLFVNIKLKQKLLHRKFRSAQVAPRTVVATIALLTGGRALAQNISTPAQPSAPAALLVTDEAGRKVSVPQPVRRVVSLAPSLTETIYALGAQEKLVGVTDYCDYPPEAKNKPKVGGVLNPSIEQIVALKPDLVLATRSANRHETVEALARLGIACYATYPRSVEEVLTSTLHLGEVIGMRERGEAIVAALRERLADLRHSLAGSAPRRILFVVWQDPLISVGRRTFLGDALRWAGADTLVETSQEWPRVSLEEVVRLQPDYLVFASSQSELPERTAEGLRSRPGWRGLDAVRQRHIVMISEAINRPAPRLVDAIEELARQLHPAAFGEKQENREERIENTKKNSDFEDCLSSSFYFSTLVRSRTAIGAPR